MISDIIIGKSKSNIKGLIDKLPPIQYMEKCYEYGFIEYADELLKSPPKTKRLIAEIRNLNTFKQLKMAAKFGLTSLFIELWDIPEKNNIATGFFTDIKKQAIINKRYDIVKYLIDTGCVLEKGLSMASVYNQYEMVELLLTSDITKIHHINLRLSVLAAYNHKYIDILKLLLSDERITKTLSDGDMEKFKSIL